MFRLEWSLDKEELGVAFSFSEQLCAGVLIYEEDVGILQAMLTFKDGRKVGGPLKLLQRFGYREEEVRDGNMEGNKRG